MSMSLVCTGPYSNSLNLFSSPWSSSLSAEKHTNRFSFRRLSSDVDTNRDSFSFIRNGSRARNILTGSVYRWTDAFYQPIGDRCRRRTDCHLKRSRLNRCRFECESLQSFRDIYASIRALSINVDSRWNINLNDIAGQMKNEREKKKRMGAK